MNRTQRRYRTPQIPPTPTTTTRRNDSLNRFKQAVKAKVSSGIEVLHPPLKAIRKSRSKHKTTVANRCCYVSPDNKNFGQYFVRSESPKKCTDAASGPAELDDENQLDSFLNDHFLDPGKSVSIVKEPKNVSRSCRSSRNKMKSSPQHSRRSSHSHKKALFDESDWLKLDRPEDVDTIIESKALKRPSVPKFISDVPRVKVIAEKFSKYKKGNLELRRLDEKVVCVEYDVFNESSHHDVEATKPVQRLRTFFSIKPSGDKDNKDQGLPRLPPNIKNEFDVLEEDLEKLTEKEIEFIDTDIEENQSYLDDLRRILKRKEVISANKNRTTLDLQCLYEMAKRDGRPLKTDYSAMNLLTKEELKEVKQLILERCTSSVHGFRRRTIKKQGTPADPSVISDNLMTEMLRCET